MTKKEILDLVANYRAEVRSVVGEHLAGEALATELDDLFAELADHVKDDKFEIDDLDEYDDEDLVDLVEHLKDKGYTVLNFDNLIERSKLDDFLRSEIFPRYNDQKAFL